MKPPKKKCLDCPKLVTNHRLIHRCIQCAAKERVRLGRNKPKKPRIEKPCGTCGETMIIPAYGVGSKRKYCSSKCAGVAWGKMIPPRSIAKRVEVGRKLILLDELLTRYGLDDRGHPL